MDLIVIYPKVEAKIFNDCVCLLYEPAPPYLIIDVAKLKECGKYQGIREGDQYFYVSKNECTRLYIKEKTPYPCDYRSAGFNLSYSDPEFNEKYIKFLLERICTVLEVP